MISQGKFDRAYAGLNAAAKKVYEAVPIAEGWLIQQIIGELSRRGLQLDYRVVQGSLARLQDVGLIRQLTRNEFRREGLRVADPKEQTIEEDETDMIKKETTTAIAAAFSKLKPEPVAAPSATSIDTLIALAGEVGRMSISLKKLSTDISDAVIEIQCRSEAGESAAARIAELEAKLVEAEADRLKLRKFQEAFSALSA